VGCRRIKPAIAGLIALFFQLSDSWKPEFKAAISGLIAVFLQLSSFQNLPIKPDTRLNIKPKETQT